MASQAEGRGSSDPKPRHSGHVNYGAEPAPWQAALLIGTCLLMQETRETPALSSRQEDLLEQGRATRSSILACRIPWTEEPGGLQPVGSQRVGHDRRSLAHLQASPLEAPPVRWSL